MSNELRKITVPARLTRLVQYDPTLPGHYYDQKDGDEVADDGDSRAVHDEDERSDTESES